MAKTKQNKTKFPYFIRGPPVVTAPDHTSGHFEHDKAADPHTSLDNQGHMRTAGGSPRPQGTCPHTSKCIHLHEVQAIHLRRMCMDPQVQKRGGCKGGGTQHTTHTLPKAQHSKSCMVTGIAGGSPSLADTHLVPPHLGEQGYCLNPHPTSAGWGRDKSMKAQPGTHHTTQHTQHTHQRPDAGT